MKLTYQFRIKEDNKIVELMKISKEFYNMALYEIRQSFIKTGKYLNYYDIEKLMKTKSNLDNKILYKLLPAQTSQQILKVLDKNWKSYFVLLKKYKENVYYNQKPNIPGYIRKNENILIFTNQNLVLKNNRLKNKKFNINIKIPQKGIISNFQQFRIVKKNNILCGEIVYEKKININPNTDKNKVMAIDLGLNNLAALTDNIGNNPILINGKGLKSYNQLYNKKRSKLKTIITNGKNVKNVNDKKYFKSTKRMIKLDNNRFFYFKNFLHHVSKNIINICLYRKIGTICVGESNGIKTSIRLGKHNNQHFVQCPIQQLTAMIKYKAEMEGINVICTEESYTSKCDSLSLEPLKNNKTFIGKRIFRGLFASSKGLINADVNGSINIHRKVFGDNFGIQSLVNSGILFNPIKIRNPQDSNSFKQFLLKGAKY